MTVTGEPRHAPHTQTQLSIKLDGTRLSRDLVEDLLEVRIDLGVRTIGRAQLTFVDRDGSLAASTLRLGTEVEISSVEPALMVFSGVVTGVDMEADTTGTRVSATVQDAAYGLARNRGVATYQDVTHADIITTLTREAGLSAELAGLRPSPLSWMLRADSALGLIDEIAGRTGFDWMVSKKTLTMWKVSEQAPWGREERALDLGVELLAFSVRQSDLGPTEFTVRGWDPQQRKSLASVARPAAARDGFQPPSGTPAKVLAAKHAISTDADLNDVAAGLAANAGRVTGRGRATFLPEVRPGSVVKVRGAGDADGRYYVREVSHHVDAGSLRTQLVVGDRPPVRLSDPWGLAASVSSLRRSGLTVAVVDNTNDPDKVGRVRVQLVGMAEDASSAWARVLTLGAGDKRGLVLMPEVGDEVLVAFEDDDVRRPVVLGGLYSAKATPAGPASVAEAGEVISRHLVSAQGHRLELADGKEPGSQFVQLTLADEKHRLRIAKDAAELAAPDVPLTISSGGAKISFDGRGNLTIEATSLTLKAKEALAVEGMNVKLKATTDLEASGVKVVLNGSAQAAVKSGGLTEISGSMVKIN